MADLYRSIIKGALDVNSGEQTLSSAPAHYDEDATTAEILDGEKRKNARPPHREPNAGAGEHLAKNKLAQW